MRNPRFGPITRIAEINPLVPLAGVQPESEASFLAMADVSESGRVIQKQVRRVKEVAIGFTRFLENDTLFAKITPCMEHGKGALATGLLNGRGFGSTEFHVLRPIGDTDPRFVFWMTQFREYRAVAERQMTGSAGQQRVPASFFAETQVFLPERGEQQRIANILTTIDNQIEKTEALIAKYQSIKQGLMYDMFTRGVDEQGRLRPSRDEVPQLYKESEVGFIPASWSVKALQSLVAAGSSITYGVVQPGPEDDQGVRFVRGGDVYDGEIDISQLRTISKAISATYRRTLLRGGELVMSLVGYPGEVAVIPAELREANIARQVALIRLDEEVVTPFVMEYLLSSIGKTRLFEKQNGSAQQVINLADLKFVQVTLPLRDEQTAIANHLKTARDRIDSEKSHLTKLRSLKLGLMQDLLTGKVPVKPEPEDQDNGIGAAKAGVKSRGEGVHA